MNISKEYKSPQKEGLGPGILSREGQSAFGSVRRKYF